MKFCKKKYKMTLNAPILKQYPLIRIKILVCVNKLLMNFEYQISTELIKNFEFYKIPKFLENTC